MKYLKERRNKLLASLKEHSLLLLYSGNLKRQSEDANYDFFVNRNFYYLTNISQENTYFILDKDTNKSYLFIDEYNPKKEKWYGKKLTAEEAKSISGVDEVLLNAIFPNTLKSLLNNKQIIYVDLDQEESNALIKDYKTNYLVENAYPLISSLRIIKDEEEINNIKEAIKITDLGLKRVIKELNTAKNEFEVYNAFNHEILNHGTHEIAFPSIIASGVHTCCLHYPTPLDKLASNSLILCDVGAAYKHYCADITRTYPINGKFNDLQKKIYEIVLNCNKEVIKQIKPDINLKDLQKFAKSYLAGECLNKGLIKNVEEIDNYYFHSVSHPLGLNTHDVGGRDFILKPGMVLTVEPGLYFKEHSIGVRIEDDVLVTSSGREVLSKDIVKEIHDIENLFKE